ncbi:MAG: iron ABC transporter permease [Bacteroidota bacterium]
MKRARIEDYLLLILLTIVLVAYFLYPLALTFVESLRSKGGLSPAEYLRFFDLSSLTNLEALLNSALLSALSVLLSGIVGTGLAYIVNEFEFPLKGLLKRVAVLPIALPPLVGVVAFWFLYGESGIIPRAMKELLGLQKPPLYLEGFVAILFVHTYSFYVYFYLFASALLRRIDPAVIEAAVNLGSSQWRTLQKVILPLLTPALVGASLLTFMASMASFSAPFLFGGGKRFMTTQIYNAKLNGDMGLASTHSIVLVVISILFLLLLRRYSGKRRYVQATKGVSRRLSRRVTKFSRALATVTALVALLFILLPAAGILLISFAKEGSWTWQLLPSAYTLENYLKLLTEEGVFRPIANSAAMAALATAANVVFGVIVAFLITRRVFSPRGVGLGLEIALALPFAIPGTVIALSLILALNRPTLFTGGQVLVGTFWILPLAYFTRNIPIVVRSTTAGFQQLDRSLEEAAHNLGASTWRTFWKVIFPSILPSIISGALLAFIAALGEFVSSILLYTYDNRPISVEILAQFRLGNFGGAAAYGVFLLILVIGVTSLAGIWRGEDNLRETFVF